jgi:hypothetical protein
VAPLAVIVAAIIFNRRRILSKRAKGAADSVTMPETAGIQTGGLTGATGELVGDEVRCHEMAGDAYRREFETNTKLQRPELDKTEMKIDNQGTESGKVGEKTNVRMAELDSEPPRSELRYWEKREKD